MRQCNTIHRVFHPLPLRGDNGGAAVWLGRHAHDKTSWARKGQLNRDGNPAPRARPKAALTGIRTARIPGVKAGPSDPSPPMAGGRWYEKSYPEGNRIVRPESPHRRPCL